MKNVSICYTLPHVINKVQDIENVIVNKWKSYNEKKLC